MDVESQNMKKIEDMFKQISTQLHAMDQKMEQVLKDMDNLQQDNKQLKDHITVQDRRIEILEREIRRRNIIIKGLKDEERESADTTEEKIRSLFKNMAVPIDINSDTEEIRRVGKYKEGVNRPIVVKFINGRKKLEILKNTKILKGTQIWIDEDYSKEIQNERRILIPQLKDARQRGYNAKLRYNKLIINNETYGIHGLIRSEPQLIKHVDNKRTMSDRSPDAQNYTEQINKITKTTIEKN